MKQVYLEVICPTTSNTCNVDTNLKKDAKKGEREGN